MLTVIVSVKRQAKLPDLSRSSGTPDRPFGRYLPDQRLIGSTRPMPPAVCGCSRVTRQDPRIDANQFCRRHGAVSWR
jgi:hypothetical protein